MSNLNNMLNREMPNASIVRIIPIIGIIIIGERPKLL